MEDFIRQRNFWNTRETGITHWSRTTFNTLNISDIFDELPAVPVTETFEQKQDKQPGWAYPRLLFCLNLDW